MRRSVYASERRVADASRFTYDASRENGRHSAHENPYRSDALDEQRKQVEANLSADLVKHLQSQGMTLRRIGESRRVGTAHHYPSRWNKEWCAVHTLRGRHARLGPRVPGPLVRKGGIPGTPYAIRDGFWWCEGCWWAVGFAGVVTGRGGMQGRDALATRGGTAERVE